MADTSKDLLIDAVFGDRGSEGKSGTWARSLLPWIFAFGVHVALLSVAQSSDQSMAVWSTEMAASIREELRVEEAIAIETVPLPPEVEEPSEDVVEAEAPEEVERRESPRRPVRREVREAATEAPEVAEAAEAGSIIAQTEEVSAPVDFTEESFVVGAGSVYAGGATRSDGTSSTAGRAGLYARHR